MEPSPTAAATRKVAHFTGKGSAAEHPDDGFLDVRDIDDLNAAGEHNEHAVLGVALIEENFAGPRVALLA